MCGLDRQDVALGIEGERVDADLSVETMHGVWVVVAVIDDVIVVTVYQYGW